MKTQEEIVSLLKARNPLLWIQTVEEQRAEKLLLEAAEAARYEVWYWDCASGFTTETGEVKNAGAADVLVAMRTIRDDTTRRIYVMRDIHRWLGMPVALRLLRSVARKLLSVPPKEARAIVLLTPSADVPPELGEAASMVDFPLPNREEIGRILDTALQGASRLEGFEPLNGAREAAVDAAVGLTATQASNCYARSIVTLRKIDPQMVMNEKKRVIAAEKVLTWYDPDPRGLAAVGGLERLKDWLVERQDALGSDARTYGLPAPKGVMLVGVPGCGKSLSAKAVATAWGVPLLRLDLGALRSKWVGESEGNIRRALAVAETVSPCIVWIDEIEKALAGSGSQASDGGVAADALGTILSWMQERAGSVFVVATANEVSSLPPELLRKGRFDELFFVDLPTEAERKAILEVSIKQLQPKTKVAWSTKLAAATRGFTGAEIAAMVPDAMFRAFRDKKRAINEKDLLAVASTVAKLSSTAAERIEALRAWAKGRARLASAPETDRQGEVREYDE